MHSKVPVYTGEFRKQHTCPGQDAAQPPPVLARLEPVLRNKGGRDSERPAHAMKSGPHLPQLEKALAQKRRPNTAKKKYLLFKNILGLGLTWWCSVKNLPANAGDVGGLSPALGRSHMPRSN